VTVLVLLRPGTAELAEPPEYLHRGSVHSQESLERATGAVTKALKDAAGRGITEGGQLEDIIAKAVAQSLGRNSRREPVVIALVLDS
jgi:ribonuclease J